MRKQNNVNEFNACDCAEGKTQRTLRWEGDRRVYDEVYTPTGLHVHDCAYIRERNAALRLPAGEAAPEETE